MESIDKSRDANARAAAGAFLAGLKQKNEEKRVKTAKELFKFPLFLIKNRFFTFVCNPMIELIYVICYNSLTTVLHEIVRSIKPLTTDVQDGLMKELYLLLTGHFITN
uniref:Cnd1 domain-containing protein n=1 Tax=Heterorhabditis bacteriophora TaxID=37862 RepID=A0A1I7WNC0_HETBA